MSTIFANNKEVDEKQAQSYIHDDVQNDGASSIDTITALVSEGRNEIHIKLSWMAY